MKCEVLDGGLEVQSKNIWFSRALIGPWWFAVCLLLIRFLKFFAELL